MASSSLPSISSFSFLVFLIFVATLSSGAIPKTSGKELSIKEATVLDLQLAFKRNQLTSRQLVEFYLKEIQRLNPVIRGVIENPYTLGNPHGSSSGSGISAAANLATVTLGTETDGSILCPSESNSVVGIKPTVGLTSRAGVVPISLRQDSVGPICRTVSDAAYVLEAIVGIDARDKATIEASQYIPKGGYDQFLNVDGLRGKRLGIFVDAIPFFLGNDTFKLETFVKHLKTLRKKGAVLVDNLELDVVKYYSGPSENIALAFEFKLALNAYLKDLVELRHFE
ncbi:hypothetical protein L6164_025294 [Bauhinia variegata]|uniref:Uncharacterized protein n=1 Tax=Bauhinia variegata TaxID=167791 RepID=A0ACB9M1H6_BAUVA|nr:hypothetical protein L6164_025294 [Bauhinia variegata]